MWQIFASLCALSYAGQNLVVKVVTRYRVDSRTVLWFMFAAAVPVLWIFYATATNPAYDPAFPYYLGAGVSINVLAFYGYVRAIELADVSLVAPLLSLSPLFMLLTSWIMVSEVPDGKGLIGILLVVFGTYFLAGGRAELDLGPLRKLVNEPGPRWALAVAVLWSITANIDKLCVEASSPRAYTFWFHLMFSLVFTPIYFSLRSGSFLEESDASTRRDLLVIVCGLLGVGLLQALMVVAQMTALTGTNVTYVIAIKRAGMLVTVLGGGLLLGEEDFPRRLLAA
jgi:drug/metabolite transporter (DMT)-like permease